MDHANYLTTPSLAWDAMLLQTDVKLEPLCTLDMLRVVEHMKRGGPCFFGSTRYVQANNQHMKNMALTRNRII